jgi:hypothetical protein
LEAPVIDTLITAISYALVGALFVANCAFQLTAFWWTRNSGAAMRQLIRTHGGNMNSTGNNFHLITAEEARTLREAATPGPWSSLPLTVDLIGPVLVGLRPLRDGDSDLLVAAPDLAATVEALHAEVERLRALLAEVTP